LVKNQQTATDVPRFYVLHARQSGSFYDFILVKGDPDSLIRITTRS